jgi:hypothetical protein
VYILETEFQQGNIKIRLSAWRKSKTKNGASFQNPPDRNTLCLSLCAGRAATMRLRLIKSARIAAVFFHITETPPHSFSIRRK